MAILDPSLNEFQFLLEHSQRVVVFTGAGVSTESGIPDFRSPGGIWAKYQPIEFGDFLASEEIRAESWRRKFATERTMNEASPNVGHMAIAKLVREKKVSSVITQNVDGLHQISGIPDEQVIELHGNTTYASCLDCKTRYDLAPIRDAFMVNAKLPICTKCNGIVKTATISFGQSMPPDKMHQAQSETKTCDLFIAIGSSLVVYPAAGFPVYAKESGAALVIINRDPTDLDSLADLVLHREIGQTLRAIVDLDA